MVRPFMLGGSIRGRRLATGAAAALTVLSSLAIPFFAQDSQAPPPAAAKGGKGAPKAMPAKPLRPVEPTPRWPDGRVNLGAAPGHKGYWELRPNFAGRPTGAVPFQTVGKSGVRLPPGKPKNDKASVH